MTVPPSKSFTSSDCTAEWTVSFFLVLSRMDSLCPARFPSYPSRMPLLSTLPATSHSFASFTSLYRISSAPTFPLPHRKVDSHSHLFYFIFLFIHIFFQILPFWSSTIRCIVRQVYPFVRFSHRQSVTQESASSHMVFHLHPFSCCNNNSPPCSSSIGCRLTIIPLV